MNQHFFRRNTDKPPDRYGYTIKTSGGTVSYSIPVMKVKAYSLDDIFSKRRLLLIPFFIFSFEPDFSEYNDDDEKRGYLKGMYRKIIERLDQLERDDETGEMDKLTIIELADEVLCVDTEFEVSEICTVCFLSIQDMIW